MTLSIFACNQRYRARSWHMSRNCMSKCIQSPLSQFHYNNCQLSMIPYEQKFHERSRGVSDKFGSFLSSMTGYVSSTLTKLPGMATLQRPKDCSGCQSWAVAVAPNSSAAVVSCGVVPTLQRKLPIRLAPSKSSN